MCDQPVTLKQAQRLLCRSRSTLIRQIQKGAPVAVPGRPGRGGATLVCVACLKAWERNGQLTAMPLDLLEVAMLNALRRDGGAGEPLHRTLGIPDRKAAALYLRVFEFFHRGLVGSDARDLPNSLERLVASR
jgi:hypothetical protein